MKDFIVFTYSDATDCAAANDGEKWGKYLAKLRDSGCFEGGSSIGPGLRLRKGYPDTPSKPELNGFIRIRADDLLDAQRFLTGNPFYEAGGTVEIRDLPLDA